MLNNIVAQISGEFLCEAKNSPRLLEDMAAMEKFMAESYDGRVFIELMQNADDAGSTKVKLCEFAGNLLFANNGRPFDENDVISICRSGASSKQRGKSIGYRGIGFKSTTYITNEIIIYSSDTYFTFSKTICSQRLNKEIDKVPTVRIPFNLDLSEIKPELLGYIRNLMNEGYGTIFVFKDAKLDEFFKEIRDINFSYFIFLNKIENCEIDVKGYKSIFSLKRAVLNGCNIISISGSEKDQWLLVGNTSSSKIAFRFQAQAVVSCNDDEAVYYCFLPTYDKVTFPIKINGDFSTDPSRKHIITDELTMETIQQIARDLYELILSVLNGEASGVWANLLQILSQKNSFSKTNIILSEEIKKKMVNSKQLILNNGKNQSISTYKLFPDWLEESEQIFIRRNSSYISNQSINLTVYDNCPMVDCFIKQYSNEKYSLVDFLEMMSDKAFVEDLIDETKGKIIGNIIKLYRTQSIFGEQHSLEKVVLHNDERSYYMADLIQGKEKKLDQQLKVAINQYAAKSDIIWFCETNSIDKDTLLIDMPKAMKGTDKEITVSSFQSKPSISKWRSAEQQCAELENNFGYDPTDVSKQNLGYDIVSKVKNGTMRYIEVKSLISKGASFSMTNNEYTAAHQYGDSYFLCLIIQSERCLNALYICNPLKNLQLEKRVKMWEWYCDDYWGEEVIIEF